MQAFGFLIGFKLGSLVSTGIFLLLEFLFLVSNIWLKRDRLEQRS